MKRMSNVRTLCPTNSPAWLAISQNSGGFLAIGSPTQGDWGGGFIMLGRDDGPNGGAAVTGAMGAFRGKVSPDRLL